MVQLSGTMGRHVGGRTRAPPAPPQPPRRWDAERGPRPPGRTATRSREGRGGSLGTSLRKPLQPFHTETLPRKICPASDLGGAANCGGCMHHPCQMSPHLLISGGLEYRLERGSLKKRRGSRADTHSLRRQLFHTLSK